MKIVKTFIDKCPVTGCNNQIKVDYIKATSSEHPNRFIKGLYECAIYTCEIKECPIAKSAPDYLDIR